ncbi:MAG: hypothetical protein QOI02_1472 [Actinomycetota bacterium]|nr:hypothetical protein [Actinomycetota bacterium]
MNPDAITDTGMLRLRPFGTADYAEVTSWFADAGELRFFAGRRLHWPLDDAQWDLLRQDPALTAWSAVIGDDDAPVGHGELVEESSTVVRFARIAVHPYIRGRGFGHMLVQRMIDKAVGGGYQTVTLFVHPDNTLAIRGYRGLGFVPVSAPVADHRMRMTLDLLP